MHWRLVIDMNFQKTLFILWDPSRDSSSGDINIRSNHKNVKENPKENKNLGNMFYSISLRLLNTTDARSWAAGGLLIQATVSSQTLNSVLLEGISGSEDCCVYSVDKEDCRPCLNFFFFWATGAVRGTNKTLAACATMCHLISSLCQPCWRTPAAEGATSRSPGPRQTDGEGRGPVSDDGSRADGQRC